MAVITVLARNLFRAALGLLGVLVGTAALFLLLQAEMVALVQVMVYIGGIMIFVLYAVLLTSELGGKMPGPSPLKWVFGLAVAGTALAFLVDLVHKAHCTLAASLMPAADGANDAATGAVNAAASSGATAVSGGVASMHSLGLRLLDAGPNGFLVPFELISVLLLAAMVGAIALARHDTREGA